MFQFSKYRKKVESKTKYPDVHVNLGRFLSFTNATDYVFKCFSSPCLGLGTVLGAAVTRPSAFYDRAQYLALTWPLSWQIRRCGGHGWCKWPQHGTSHDRHPCGKHRRDMAWWTSVWISPLPPEDDDQRVDVCLTWAAGTVPHAFSLALFFNISISDLEYALSYVQQLCGWHETRIQKIFTDVGNMLSLIRFIFI